MQFKTRSRPNLAKLCVIRVAVKKKKKTLTYVKITIVRTRYLDAVCLGWKKKIIADFFEIYSRLSLQVVFAIYLFNRPSRAEIVLNISVRIAARTPKRER